MRGTKYFLLSFYVMICIKNMRSIPNNLAHLAVIFYHIIFQLKNYILLKYNL